MNLFSINKTIIDKPAKKQKRKRILNHQKYNCACDGGKCCGECRDTNLFRERVDKELICPAAFLEN